MMTIDLLRGDEETQRARRALDVVREARKATLARYRQTEKHKEQQRRYLDSEKGRSARNRSQKERRLLSPPKPLTGEARERKLARGRERAAERYRSDPEYRARVKAAGQVRNKKPKTPEQRERARKASREFQRRWAETATPEEKAAKYAATQKWRESLSADRREQEQAKHRVRWNAWMAKKYRTDPAFRALQLNRCEQRRARLKVGPDAATLSTDSWVALRAEYGACAYCGKSESLTQDHVLALKHGGKHTLENVVPACGICNSKKGSLLPGDAFEKLGIDPDIFWERHERIVRKIRGES
jgi:5-methylcytosine-specific restriction endonuclease McrA